MKKEKKKKKKKTMLVFMLYTSWLTCTHIIKRTGGSQKGPGG
jgi:hypothetical protein